MKYEAISLHKFFYKIDAELGEGLIWDAKNELLYWVDIEEKCVYCYDYKSKTCQKIDVGNRVGTIVPITQNIVLVALENGLASDTTKHQLTYILKTPHLIAAQMRFNDGKCDAFGRFWVGTMPLQGKEKAAKLYMLENNKTLTPILSSTSISNGLAWSLDNKTMYYIDTPTLCVMAFDYDVLTGKISDGKKIIDIPKSLCYPDRMTMDEDGKFWIALWDGFAVARFNPLTGKLLCKITVPAPKITSCCFGGENLDELFISTARCDMDVKVLEKYPVSGSIFNVKTGYKGVGVNYFKPI